VGDQKRGQSEPLSQLQRRYVYEGSKPERGLSLGVVIVTALIVGLMSGALAAIVTLWVDNRVDAVPGLHVSLQPASQGRAPTSGVTEIADAVLPTVVSLSVQGNGQASTGSGFVVDRRGYLVTNNHVVSAAVERGTIVATFSTGRRATATIVGRSPTYDLAVLKVDVDDLPVATLGDSDQLNVGDSVVAVGAPLGLNGTVTTGIISSLNRPVTTSDAGEASYISAVQTDAAINPGNSGGPLVDGRGHVIGIATAIATLGDGQSGSIGLGFAIPVTKARTIIEQLINDGEAEYPVVGVTLDLSYTGPGARVQPDSAAGEAVTTGGPAEQAGIQPGDLIVAVDGQRIASPQDFVVLIRTRLPGDDVDLTVVRDDERLVLPVTLGATVG
jgi:putative serine protease PepD